MTELLFYKDKRITDFTATVIGTVCDRNGRHGIVLDRTAFFPEQGGQYADPGTIDGITVTDVTMDSDNVIHFIPEDKVSCFKEGQVVNGTIDWKARFDRMQNHTGEHILCGIIHRKFGYENVGFHLSDDIVTMDISGELTPAQLEETEAEANAAVWENHPVTILYPTREEATEISYRSKLDICEGLRLVIIEGVDTCACCALHVDSTAEVGMIKIVKSMRYKGGMRLTICCGNRALCDYRNRFRSTCEISALLKVPEEDIVSGVKDSFARIERLRTDLYGAKSLYASGKMNSVISSYNENSGNIVLGLEDCPMEILRNTANMATGILNDGSCVIVYSKIPSSDGFSFVLAIKEGDIVPLSKKIISELKGRGGGRGNMVSGTLFASEEEITGYFKI